MKTNSEKTDVPNDEPEGSLVVRFGGLAFGSLVATVFGCLPAAMRFGGNLPAVLMLLSVLMIPAATLTALFVAARQGLRGFVAESDTLVASLLLWGSTMGIVGTGVGMVLRASTHHWALSAVTFSVLMLFAAPGVALFVKRFAGIAQSSVLRVRIYLGVSAGLFILTLLVLSTRIGHGDRSTAAIVLDVTAWVLGALLGSTDLVRRIRIASYIAPPVCVALAIVGLRFANPERAMIAQTHAPAFGALLQSMPGFHAR